MMSNSQVRNGMKNHLDDDFYASMVRCWTSGMPWKKQTPWASRLCECTWELRRRWWGWHLAIRCWCWKTLISKVKTYCWSIFQVIEKLYGTATQNNFSFDFLIHLCVLTWVCAQKDFNCWFFCLRYLWDQVSQLHKKKALFAVFDLSDRSSFQKLAEFLTTAKTYQIRTKLLIGNKAGSLNFLRQLWFLGLRLVRKTHRRNQRRRPDLKERQVSAMLPAQQLADAEGPTARGFLRLQNNKDRFDLIIWSWEKRLMNLWAYTNIVPYSI